MHPPNPSKKKGMRRKESLERRSRERKRRRTFRNAPHWTGLGSRRAAAGLDAAEKQRREELRGQRGQIRPGGSTMVGKHADLVHGSGST
jgi:hypothetical protein